MVMEASGACLGFTWKVARSGIEPENISLVRECSAVELQGVGGSCFGHAQGTRCDGRTRTFKPIWLMRPVLYRLSYIAKAPRPGSESDRGACAEACTNGACPGAAVSPI